MTPDLARARRGALLTLAGAAATLFAPGLRAQASRPPLRVALAPFLSPAALLAAFQPLREHLERTLAQPVEMVTEKDFRTLAQAAQRGDHDVVQLPAHLARLAMVDWRYQMIAAPVEPVTVIVGVRAEGPVRSAADLRGRSVGMLDALSLTATVGRRWLQMQGIADAVTVVALPSVNSALYALDRGDVAAFVAADTQLVTLPPSTPRGETVLATIGGIPGPLFVARPALPAAELAAMRAAMAAFRPDPTRPPSAANSTLRPLDDARLVALDVYVAIARQALAAPR
jgi:phosphonate transport system substrate-binding protein